MQKQPMLFYSRPNGRLPSKVCFAKLFMDSSKDCFCINVVVMLLQESDKWREDLFYVEFHYYMSLYVVHYVGA